MLLTTLAAFGSVAGFQLAEPRTEYLVNPIGLEQTSPRFSWIINSDAKGFKQTKYRLIVASDPGLLAKGKGDLWDSGEVASDKTNQIAYQGKPLWSRARAWWKAYSWDNSGGRSETKPATFELGMLNSKDWAGSWIHLPESPSMNKDDRPATYFRREFKVLGRVKSARAYVSARGLYRFFVDGQAVGESFYTPGWTDYRKRIQYQVYDVTKFLKKGMHAAGMVLGDGWYCGRIGLTGKDNYGKYPEGLVQIEIEYADGQAERIVSNRDWISSLGPIRSNDMLMGENYDARLELGNWSSAGYKADNWVRAETSGLGDVPLVGTHYLPAQVLEEIKPLTLKEPKPATYVYDLGQNMVGFARLKVKGKAGDKVTLRFAEMLNPDGTMYTANLRGAKATDTYILKGGGTEVYEPTFTSHGFRYVEITGYPGKPGMDAVTGVVVSSQIPKTGEFSCSNPLVNQLQHNIFWGQRGNYLEVPTDCPQRDERLGWMGDAQIFVRTAAFNNDISAFMTKWCQDVIDAQSKDGGFSDVTPRMGDLSDGAPGWGDAGVIVPWTIYLCYGDTRILERAYESMAKWINYIDSANPNHIWAKRGNNNFGDWLNVQDDTPRDLLGTYYFAYSTSIMAKTARVLGKTEDAEKYEALWNEIKKAFAATFVSPDGTIKGDTQTAYVLALRFDLMPDSQRQIAADKLVNHIMVKRNGHLSTGFLGVGYLNRVLTNAGRNDVAYKLLQNDTYPSWGYSIRQGATTIWERWDGWTETKGFQDPGMNSFNHYSMGSVGEWMYETVAGIALDPTRPGYEHILIHPIPGGGMTWAKASLKSIRGPISSSWKIEKGVFVLDVTIPANTTATVFVPAGSASDVNAPAEAQSNGVKNGEASFEIGSGSYRFTAKMAG